MDNAVYWVHSTEGLLVKFELETFLTTVIESPLLLE